MQLQPQIDKTNPEDSTEGGDDDEGGGGDRAGRDGSGGGGCGGCSGSGGGGVIGRGRTGETGDRFCAYIRGAVCLELRQRNTMATKEHCFSALVAAATLLFLLPILLASAQDAPAPKKVLPSYVPVCKRKDADLAGCVKRAVETLRPRLRKGISRLRVQPLEPFTLPALRVERDLPALRVNASLADIRVDGASDFQIQKLRVDPENLMVTGEVLLPLLRVNCKYAITGRILSMPLQGRGNFRGNFSNVHVTASGRGKRTNEGGVDHVTATSLNLRMRLGTSDVDFDNEDPDSAATANAALAFVRSNSDAVLEVVTPVAEETAEEVALQMINSIFMRLPYNEILPDV